MRSTNIILVSLVWLLLASCQRTKHKAPQAPQAPTADAAPAAATRPLPQQLLEAREALRTAVEAGTLDQVGVHAFRLRDLTHALAVSDARRFGAAADTVREASERMQTAAEHGDLGAVRQAWPGLQRGLARFDDAPDVAQLQIAPQSMDSRSVTLTGEIIDPQCYFTHDSRGAAHASCAAICAKGGQGLAFLDDATGIVYPLIARSHGASQNEGLLPHLGKPVQVKGVVYRKAGNAVLLVQSVARGSAKSK